jgi:hypothetical protein
MDKKTILAFVLSFAVLVAWSPSCTQTGANRSPVEDTRRTDRLAPTTPGVRRWKSLRSGGCEPEKEVTWKPPLQSRVFEHGASFKLKKYRLKADQFASGELVL